jgi:Zn-dependent metalloprotease
MKLLIVSAAALCVAFAHHVEHIQLSETVNGVEGATEFTGALGLVHQATRRGAVATADDQGHGYEIYADEDMHDGRSVRVTQKYHGFDVWGYTVSVFEASNGVHSYDGIYAQGLDGVASEGDFEAMDAKKHEIMAKVKADFMSADAPTHDLGLELEESIKPVIFVNDEGTHAQKAYFVRFIDVTKDEPSYPNFIVNEDGEVVDQWEALQTHTAAGEAAASGPGGNRKIGKTNYNKQLQVTEIGNNKCKLEYKYVRTVNLKNSYSRSKTTPWEFPCYTQTTKEVNGAYAPMNDAHFYGSAIFNGYLARYKRQPLKTVPLLLKVHYGRSYENAFWDGKSMTFGDGRSRFYPLTSLDVVAHEVSHGVTEQTSGLEYRGMSGGLNEAFSDMAGKAIEAAARPNTFTWGVGYDITKGKKALRCMDNPPCDGRSIDDVRKYRGQNVHYTSGVFNKVYYLISTKSKGGFLDAFDIMYTANTKYWGKRTTFAQAAELTLKAAEHLRLGTHMPEVNHAHLNLNLIVGIFKQVGLNCQGSGDKYSCKNL